VYSDMPRLLSQPAISGIARPLRIWAAQYSLEIDQANL